MKTAAVGQTFKIKTEDGPLTLNIGPLSTDEAVAMFAYIGKGFTVLEAIRAVPKHGKTLRGGNNA